MAIDAEEHGDSGWIGTLFAGIEEKLDRQRAKAEKANRVEKADRFARSLAEIYRAKKRKTLTEEDAEAKIEEACHKQSVFVRDRAELKAINLPIGSRNDATRWSIRALQEEVAASVTIAAHFFGVAPATVYAFRKESTPLASARVHHPAVPGEERARFLLKLLGYTDSAIGELLPVLKEKGRDGWLLQSPFAVIDQRAVYADDCLVRLVLEGPKTAPTDEEKRCVRDRHGIYFVPPFTDSE